jgi:hypothetical protein
MVVLQVDGDGEAADGYVGVVEGCVGDDGEGEEDAGGYEEEGGAEVGSEEEGGRCYSEGREGDVLRI